MTRFSKRSLSVICAAAIVGGAFLGVVTYWPNEAPSAAGAALGTHAVPPKSKILGSKLNSTEPMLEQSAPIHVGEKNTLQSVDSREDLYEYANAALNSNDAAVVYDGWVAARSCGMLRYSRDEYERKISTSDIDPSSEQARAIKVVLKRCRGFFDNDRLANSGLRRRLAQKVRTLNNGLYVAGISAGNPSVKQFSDIVARRDWVSFAAIQDVLLPGALQASGIASGSLEAGLFTIALMNTVCNIGMDCTPAGFSYVSDPTGLCRTPGRRN